MKDIRKEIIQVLTDVRKRQNLSYEELGKRLNLTTTSASTVISRMTRGYRSQVKIENIERYAEALDVDIIYTARLLFPDGTEQTVTGIIPRPNATTKKKRKP